MANEAPTTIAQPNATLYVSNIDWSIKKPLLRRSLYSLFSRHGKILEVITLRQEGLRGQAWIIFDDVQSATAALQAESGYTFFGKDLKVAYAKEKSDRIAKRDGTYVPKAKRRRVAPAPAPVVTQVAATETNVEAPPPPPPPPEAVETEENLPSHILFAQDLPSECNEMMLAMLFQQYAGYKEVRIPREGLAFIEFDDEAHATVALKQLNGFKLTPKDTLRIKYAKS